MNIRFSDEKDEREWLYKADETVCIQLSGKWRENGSCPVSGRDKDGRRKVLKRRKYQKKEKIRRKQHFCLDLNGKLQQL